jgi:anti-sigma regulatory factor (Ser/Thr protein kinase)
VLKGGSDAQAGEGDLVCRVSVGQIVMSYTLSEDGTRITITNPGGNPDILELARQDAVNASRAAG